MGSTSFAITSFLGGEWSQSAQGRFDIPAYKTAMNVCLNTIPIEAGAAMRRPGTRHCAPTRNGAAAKLIAFDFEQDHPYMMEFTDRVIRFFSGHRLVTTRDAQDVISISTASPAVVTTGTPHGWASNDAVIFNVNNPLLQQRSFVITVISSTTFSIADGYNAAAVPVDGSTIGTFISGAVRRIHEVVTPFAGTTWQDVRAVQAETTAVLLNGDAPQVLTVPVLPTATQYAAFALSPAEFLDGPYLKPIKGSYITAADLSGVTTFTLSFQAYSATIAYDVGDYVTSAGIGYRSLTPSNEGNTPAISPTNWLPVNAGDAINDGIGLTVADVGRLIRLFSQPALWAAGTAYVTGNIVTYSDQDDVPGYWQATGAVTGTKPGTTTLWSVVSGASVALWTWARILSVSGAGLTAPDTAIGTLTGGGGVAAAFDLAPIKALASAANHTQATVTYPNWVPGFHPIGTIVQCLNGIYQLIADSVDSVPINYNVTPPAYTNPPYWQLLGATSNVSFSDYVGQHFAAAKQVFSVTITPTIDIGITNGPPGNLTLNLRGKATAPGSASDGTLLGSTGIMSNTLNQVSILSSDTTTAWHYLWIEIIANYPQALADDGSHSFTCELGIAQVQFYSPNVANGSVFTAQIVGPALLYASTACRSWRLGVYGGANGWPKCGTYHEGRLWISGVVGNRADGSKTLDIEQIKSGIFDFAPTAPSGVVADDNAIAAVFDGPDVNAILWMVPDQQGIICGTQAGEWLLSPAGPGAMAPTNIAARRVTKIGCANIEPRRTEHTLAFVQRYGRKVMEYFADVISGKFSAPNLSERAKHLTTNNIEEIAYQQELAPIIWARTGNNGLIGATYKRDSLTTSQGPNFVGWHRHQLGSTRTVTGLCVGASEDGNLDTAYLVTVDQANGIHNVEMITDLLDEGFTSVNCWFLDNAVVPWSFTATQVASVGAPYGGVTLNGLWPLNNRTVSAYLVGIDCGDCVVVNGTTFIPFGDGVSWGSGEGKFTYDVVVPYLNSNTPPMVVGFTYTSRGQIVRPGTAVEAGSQAGPPFGKFRRVQQFAVQLYGAVNGSIRFGTSFARMNAVKLTTPGGTPYTKQQFFNGVIQSTLSGDESLDEMLCWEITRPHPAFIIAIGGFVHTSDK